MLEIERLWGREPGWLLTLPAERRVGLLAWYRCHLSPSVSEREARTKKTGASFWGSP